MLAVVAGTAFVIRLAKELPGGGVTIGGAWAQLTAFAVALGLLYLLGATVWAHQQVIGDQHLDVLGTADKVFAALILALTGNVVDRTLKTAANFGQNNEAPPL